MDKACNDPNWVINKGKREVQGNSKEERKKKGSRPENLGMVTLPYVRGSHRTHTASDEETQHQQHTSEVTHQASPNPSTP